MHDMIMLYFAVREKSADIVGQAKTAQIEDYVIEKLKQAYEPLTNSSRVLKKSIASVLPAAGTGRKVRPLKRSRILSLSIHTCQAGVPLVTPAKLRLRLTPAKAPVGVVSMVQASDSATGPILAGNGRE